DCRNLPQPSASPIAIRTLRDGPATEKSIHANKHARKPPRTPPRQGSVLPGRTPELGKANRHRNERPFGHNNRITKTIRRITPAHRVGIAPGTVVREPRAHRATAQFPKRTQDSPQPHGERHVPSHP